jgi:peptidyl-dipeptidase A
MERELYADPVQDLPARWWELVERFQMLRRPDDRRSPDWASKIHFSVAPVYYHNYMLGEVMASQLQAHLLGDVLGGGDLAWDRYVSSRDVGEYLKRHLYGTGKAYDWRETLRRATGQSLQISPFVRELARHA